VGWPPITSYRRRATKALTIIERNNAIELQDDDHAAHEELLHRRRDAIVDDQLQQQLAEDHDPPRLVLIDDLGGDSVDPLHNDYDPLIDLRDAIHAGDDHGDGGADPVSCDRRFIRSWRRCNRSFIVNIIIIIRIGIIGCSDPDSCLRGIISITDRKKKKKKKKQLASNRRTITVHLPPMEQQLIDRIIRRPMIRLRIDAIPSGEFAGIGSI
jgi:hypothetical protein